MNLYLISQDENNNYDTYDSAVVCAESEIEARKIHPGGTAEREWWIDSHTWGHTWATHYDGVKVQLIGMASSGTEKGVVLASFNAG